MPGEIQLPRRGLALPVFLRIAALTPVLALAGCGDGIEYNGRVFDMMGISGGGTKPKDARVTDRAPLVLPPDSRRLPAPGSQAASIDQQALPDDTDRHRQAVKTEAEKKKKQAGYTDHLTDPTAEPRPGLLDRLIKGKKSAEDIEVEDVPEPDPVDALPPKKTTAR